MCDSERINTIMKLRYRWFIIFLFLCILFIWGSILGLFDKVPDIENFPIYNYAENIHIDRGSQKYPRTISFQAKGSPQEIIMYYRQTLIDDGWQFVGKRGEAVTFIDRRCQLSSVEILAWVHNGKTNVEIILDQTDCR